MVFNDTVNNLGLYQQTLSLMGVDSVQWPIYKVVNSANNYRNIVTGYAIGADRRFQFDNTNHTELPIGTINLVANQSDYSFLQDEQGNTILNLLRIDCLDSNNVWRKLQPIDEAQIPMALDEFNKTAGLPMYYDKIADNIVRIYPKPVASVTNGLKFYFQRTPPYYTAASTTENTGTPPILDRGYVVAAAYDGALTLGLPNLQGLLVEKAKEEERMIDYFVNIRTPDENKRIIGVRRSSR